MMKCTALFLAALVLVASLAPATAAPKPKVCFPKAGWKKIKANSEIRDAAVAKATAAAADRIPGFSATACPLKKINVYKACENAAGTFEYAAHALFKCRGRRTYKVSVAGQVTPAAAPAPAPAPVPTPAPTPAPAPAPQ